MLYSIDDLLSFCQFKTSRSGGKGGQNVNKVETKVELVFDLTNCDVFSELEKNRILKAISNKLDNEGLLHITSEKHRSQFKNKEETQLKLIDVLSKAIKPQKKRLKTKPTKASKEKRLSGKKQRSEIKQSRKKL